PKLSALASAGRFDEFKVGFRRLVMVIGGVGFVAVVAATLIGPNAIEILYGNEYALGHRTVGLLAAGSVLFMLAQAMAQAVIALGQSTDMVPGMLYSRLRPGLNHMAFRVESSAQLTDIAEGAEEYGWVNFPSERHAIAGGAEVVYLEDRDGFEVELVAVVPG